MLGAGECLGLGVHGRGGELGLVGVSRRLEATLLSLHVVVVH